MPASRGTQQRPPTNSSAVEGKLQLISSLPFKFPKAPSVGRAPPAKKERGTGGGREASLEAAHRYWRRKHIHTLLKLFYRPSGPPPTVS